MPLKGDKIASYHTRKKYEVTEIGIMHPEEVPVKSLNPGQVGYIACNMKQSSEGKMSLHILADIRTNEEPNPEAHIGDTLHRAGSDVKPLEGFKPAKAMVGLAILSACCLQILYRPTLGLRWCLPLGECGLPQARGVLQ